jgi:chemotaxis protein histidine kinase CheA
MGSETLPNRFIFNEKMDAEALYSLYTDDFSYIEEMFSTALQHFDADFNQLQLAYENAHLEDIRKAVHKIKPTFGYAGMLHTQALCKAFEDRCSDAADTEGIAANYAHLKNALLEAKDIIQAEYSRLKTFNANPI